MKKIIFLLITLIILLSTFVAAYELMEIKPNKFSEDSYEYYKIPVQYHKGWNIIPMFSTFYSVYDAAEYNNQESLNQWRYSWKYLYLPKENNYVGIKDSKNAEPEVTGLSSPQNLQTKLYENYANEMSINLAGNWVYFTKDVTLNYYTFSEHTLQSGGEYAAYNPGWNFIVIPIEISTEELSLGDCNFDKIYQWDSAIQNWKKSTTTQMKSMVGHGFVVHTQKSCTLGTEKPGIPPALPQ